MAESKESDREVQETLEAIRRAAKHEFPSGDIEQILVEIERWYSAGLAPQTGE